MKLLANWQDLLTGMNLSFMLIRDDYKNDKYHILHSWALCDDANPKGGNRHGPYLPDIENSFSREDLIYTPAQGEEPLYYGKLIICKECKQNFLKAIQRVLEKEARRRATGNYPT